MLHPADWHLLILSSDTRAKPKDFEVMIQNCHSISLA